MCLQVIWSSADPDQARLTRLGLPACLASASESAGAAGPTGAWILNLPSTCRVAPGKFLCLAEPRFLFPHSGSAYLTSVVGFECNWLRECRIRWQAPRNIAPFPPPYALPHLDTRPLQPRPWLTQPDPGKPPLLHTSLGPLTQSLA